MNDATSNQAQRH